MKPGLLFINSSRGEVIDEEALLEEARKLSALVLDVWSNEPYINKKLIKIVDIATPHIAGYSLEGKINATVIVINKFAEFFKIKELSGFNIEYPAYPVVKTTFEIEKTYQENICLLLLEKFPILDEDMKLRDNPDKFEDIRSSYVYRREISSDIYKTFKKL